MIIKKINLYKKNGENIYECHPASNANIITYDGSLNLKDVLDTIIDSVEDIENKLNRSIYMTDSNGNIITDESGVGLVELL